MDAALKAKWVEALRSGKYQQGRRRLRDTSDQFCCLGVLCDLMAPNSWEASGTGAWLHGASYSMPSMILQREARVSEAQADCLARMNDTGESFATIADHIEANL